jgi:hypothetical protein
MTCHAASDFPDGRLGRGVHVEIAQLSKMAGMAGRYPAAISTGATAGAPPRSSTDTGQASLVAASPMLAATFAVIGATARAQLGCSPDEYLHRVEPFRITIEAPQSVSGLFLNLPDARKAIRNRSPR